LLAFKWEKHIVIISTSIGGSMMIFKSLSLVFGGWPPEELISEIIKYKAWDQITTDYWLYFLGIIIFSIGSTIF